MTAAAHIVPRYLSKKFVMRKVLPGFNKNAAAPARVCNEHFKPVVVGLQCLINIGMLVQFESSGEILLSKRKGDPAAPTP